MSQENVEVVRGMWAAYGRGDFEASLGAYADEPVWDDTRYRPDGEVHVGRDALVRLVSGWRDAWEWRSYKVEVEQLYDVGDDRVVAVLCESGRGKGGGVEFTNRWGVVATICDAKIVHTVVYRTAAEALEAVGLSE